MAAVTLTDVYDAVLTSTLRKMQGPLRDNVTRGNKTIAYLEMRGRIRRVDGGERIKVPLMYG